MTLGKLLTFDSSAKDWFPPLTGGSGVLGFLWPLNSSVYFFSPHLWRADTGVYMTQIRSLRHWQTGK